MIAHHEQIAAEVETASEAGADAGPERETSRLSSETPGR
jgi:hypothetical protein